MIIRNILGTRDIQPSTVAKLILGKSFINEYLKPFSDMKKLTSEDESMKKPKKITLKDKLENQERLFYKLNDWQFENGMENVVEGPFVNDLYIVFRHKIENIYIVFTYIPLHLLAITDESVRELKYFVFNDLDIDISTDSTEDLSYEDFLSNPVLSFKFSNKNLDTKFQNILILKKSVQNNYIWTRPVFKQKFSKIIAR